jgi:tellurite resistance protein TehA-like permease
VLVSVFLPLGPLGQGGAGIIQLGVIAQEIGYISTDFANVLYGAGILIALLMWGYAIVWLVFAVVQVGSRLTKLKFSIAWWGFTFPLGIIDHTLR